MTVHYVDRSENLAALQAQLAAAHGEPDASGAYVPESYGGRVVFHEGKAEVIPQTHVKAANMADANDGSLLSTARNPRTGSPVSLERITGEAIVKYQGMDVRVSQLEDWGVVQKTQDGRYVEAGSSNRPFVPEATPEAPEESGDMVQTVRELDRICDSVGPELSQDGLISLVDSGEVAPHVIQAVATANNITVDQAKNQIATVEAGYRKQAAAVFADAGIKDLDHFYAWCWQQEPTRTKDAITIAVTRGTTEGYRKLAKLYATNHR